MKTDEDLHVCIGVRVRGPDRGEIAPKSNSPAVDVRSRNTSLHVLEKSTGCLVFDRSGLGRDGLTTSDLVVLLVDL
jgi:hypothetical protein